MKVIPIALQSDFEASAQTFARCLVLTPKVGTAPVIRATGHDQNLSIDGHIYYAAAGGTSTDVATSSALNVDNADHHGIYNLDYISEADLRAGIYDGATVETFMVNYTDVTRGRYPQGKWTLGTITLDRATFVAQLRGAMQALQQPFGEVITPTCPYILGDSDCTKDLTSFTVNGTLDGVSADQSTLYDAARTEAGPSGSLSVTAISHGNPCVITLSGTLAQPNETALMLSSIHGPVRLNGIWTIHNKNGHTFEINVDTTDTALYPDYTGSGVASPIIADAGYFGYGLCTITSGPNAGIPREVKSSTAGQWTLQDTFPHPLEGNETYTMIAGCDKLGSTCLTKYANKDNFGGYEFVPGQDSAFEVGRQE